MGIKNFTHLYREWICHDSVTLWLCHFVTLWTINGLTTLPPCIKLGQTFFAFIWAKNCVPNFFSWARAVVPGPRAKNTLICKAISAIWQGIGLKNWNLSLKLETTIKSFIYKFQLMAVGWPAKIKLVGRHAFNQNCLPHWALTTGDIIFFYKIYPCCILILYQILLWILLRTLLNKIENLKLGRLADTTIYPKRQTLWGPINISLHFWHKIEPLSIRFCTENCWKISKLPWLADPLFVQNHVDFQKYKSPN